MWRFVAGEALRASGGRDSPAPSLPPEIFQRMDDSPDARFYVSPRLVAHIDPGTIEALTSYYAEVLADANAVLDIMSSWISRSSPSLRPSA